jgi:predicted DNA-binding transcriptional regulator AlpA
MRYITDKGALEITGYSRSDWLLRKARKAGLEIERKGRQVLYLRSEIIGLAYDNASTGTDLTIIDKAAEMNPGLDLDFDEWLSREEAIELLGLSAETLYQRSDIRDGPIRTKQIGTVSLFNRLDIIAYRQDGP